MGFLVLKLKMYQVNWDKLIIIGVVLSVWVLFCEVFVLGVVFERFLCRQGLVFLDWGGSEDVFFCNGGLKEFGCFVFGFVYVCLNVFFLVFRVVVFFIREVKQVWWG